jgi:hypothetical protein
MANNVTNQYGFDLSLKSDYWNKSPNNSSVWKEPSNNSSVWNKDWNTIGDYSGLSGVPFGSFDYSSKSNRRGDAVNKALSWLTGGTDKYRSQAQRSDQYGFMPQSRSFPGGGSWGQIAPDIAILSSPQQQQSYTVDDGQSSGGGVGSKIGGALGTIGGALIGGPVGASVGGTAGSLLGGLFG